MVQLFPWKWIKLASWHNLRMFPLGKYFYHLKSEADKATNSKHAPMINVSCKNTVWPKNTRYKSCGARCLFNDREKSQETTALKRTYCNRHANISLNYFSNLTGNVPSKQNKKMHFSFVEKFREKRFCVYFCPSSWNYGQVFLKINSPLVLI